MKDRLYNPLKLSAYRPLFGGKRVLICGAGAVGSNVAEALVKMGCSLDLLDFDTFTLENAAKHSCLVRTPEDVGQNKARCVARRVQPFLEEGCTANGVDTDLCRIGPEALADFFTFAGVDHIYLGSGYLKPGTDGFRNVTGLLKQGYLTDLLYENGNGLAVFSSDPKNLTEEESEALLEEFTEKYWPGEQQ